jgi:hypothetical protein
MFKKTICAISVCLIAQSAQAQNWLEKNIKERLEAVKQQNKEAAKASGDFSGMSQEDIAKEQAKNKAAAEKDSKLLPQGGQVEGDVDIKGIKLGMSQQEVVKLINLPIDADNRRGDPDKGCFTAKTTMNDAPNFKNGDFVIYCGKIFSYAGQTPRQVFFFFDQGKLRYVTMSYFVTGRDVDPKDPFPEVVRALTNSKYKKDPHAVLINRSGRGDQVEYSWIDSKQNRFIYSALVEKDLTGFVFKNEFVNMIRPDHKQYQAMRENLILQAVQEQKQRQATKKAGDL